MTELRPRARRIRSALRANYSAVTGFWLAALVVLMAGGVMMTAGYLLRTASSGAASLATIPGGVLIIVAFRVTPRRRPTPRYSAAEVSPVSGWRTATQTLRNMGLPDDLFLWSRFIILVLTMTSGVVMVLAGYSWAAHNWKSAAAPAVIGGVLIAGAVITVAAGPHREQRGRRQVTD